VIFLDEKKKKSFEKRQELIDAAIKEFGEKGYENASLNNILKEARISKGTFYYHFDNKEDLYMYLISIFIDEKKSFFASNVKAEDFNKDIFELLKILTQAGLEFAKQSPSISKFSESFMKERDKEIYSRMLKKFNLQSSDYYDELIERAYVRGDFREDLPKDFIKNLITYLFTHLQEVANVVKIDDFENAANYLIKFMKNGLSKEEN